MYLSKVVPQLTYGAGSKLTSWYVFKNNYITSMSQVVNRHLSSMTSRPKIFVCRNDVPESALAILNAFDVQIWHENCSVPRSELLKNIKGKDAVLVTPADKVNDEFLDAAGPQLKVVATHTVGYDHVDVEALKRRGIRLGYTPNALNDAVAELTVGILLSCTRRLFEGRDIAREGKWPSYIPLFWSNGLGLKDSVVGIIGLGRIGLEIAKRLVPFKVKEIVYTSRTDKSEAAQVNARRVDLEALLQQSDIVIVICALCPETRHLLSDKEFAAMKKTAYLVNAARGDVIDQDALTRALEAGVIAGAALDVTSPEPLPVDHKLFKLPNCCIVPHLGSAVTATRIDMLELTANNIVAGLAGTEMPAEVL